MVETASQVARAFPEHSSSTSASTPASARGGLADVDGGSHTTRKGRLALFYEAAPAAATQDLSGETAGPA
jgi:hypothetical protein